jgi:hypothetical protein
MRSPKPVTPEEAMAVWSSIKNPSSRSVAKALSQAGRRVHHSTVARWYNQGWRLVAHRTHPLEAARHALDLAVGVLTGDPAAGTKILELRPEREQLDSLSDGEVLTRSARELCISTILGCTPEEAMAVWSSIRNPSSRSVAKALSQAGRRVHHSSVARWYSQGWRPVAHRTHPLEAARQALDLAVGVLTGDPAAGTKILELRPEMVGQACARPRGLGPTPLHGRLCPSPDLPEPAPNGGEPVPPRLQISQ